VVVGICIGFIAVVWLGMSHYFEKGQYYAAYFDESVQGLGKDSAVKYRGVAIGRVDSIGVAPDGVLIQTMLKIESDLKPDTGMIAQLKSVGITGIMFIELDMLKDADRDLIPKITFPSKHKIIPTKPSDIKKIIDSATEILNHLKELDLEGISERINTSFDELNKAIRDAQLKEIADEVKAGLDIWDNAFTTVNKAAGSFNTLMVNADQTLNRVDKIVKKNEAPLAGMISRLNTSLENIDSLLGNAELMIKNLDGDRTNLVNQLTYTLENIEKATEALNSSLDAISDQPSRIIFGDPPPPRKIEP